MKTSNIPILTKVKNHKKDKHLTTDFMLQIEINNELTACRDHIGKQRPIQKMTATLCKASITVVLIFLGSRFLKLGHRESKKKKNKSLIYPSHLSAIFTNLQSSRNSTSWALILAASVILSWCSTFLSKPSKGGLTQKIISFTHSRLLSLRLWHLELLILCK